MNFDAIKIVEGAGMIDDLILLAGIIGTVILVVTGLLPALYRLGNGLARREIAIFAGPQAYGELRQLLIDSGLFWARNIRHVHSKSDLDASHKATIYLVFWPDWADAVDELLGVRRPSVPVIVYAPGGPRSIPPKDLSRLDEHRHTSVTNFRGRLLNDIVSAMITTSYEK